MLCGRDLVRDYLISLFCLTSQGFEIRSDEQLLRILVICRVFGILHDDRSYVRDLKLIFRLDMLILGLGASIYPLAPETKRQINSLGIRVDIQDTRNAAAQFNLLATERGVSEIAAAMIPISWKGRS